MSDEMINEGAVAPVDSAAPADSVEAKKPPVEASRAALVKRHIAKIKAAKKHWDDAFKVMDECIKFTANLKNYQQGGDQEKYVANLVQRHVQERTASLYAKNPRCRAKRKQRLDFQVWDGSQEMLQSAMMAAQQIQQGLLPPETAIELELLFADINNGKQNRAMLDKLGKVLEILFHHYLDSPEPKVKKQAKQLVKRVITTGLGWVKLNLQRAYDKRPGLIDEINDVTARIAKIERLTADVADGKIESEAAEMEELKQSLAALQAEPDVLVEEGIVYTFPKARAIILDTCTTQISGFIGTGWLAEEFLLTPNKVKEIYGVDICGKYTAYSVDGKLKPTAVTTSDGDAADGGENMAMLWQFYDKSTGVVFTVCEGYDDYLKEPELPAVRVKRFFPFFSLMFNELENEDGQIYPQSDIYLLIPAQKEYNRMREALRQHRIASAPFYVTSAASFEQEDEDKLAAREPHSTLKLKGVPPNADVNNILQQMKTAAIDPNMYEVQNVFQDIERVSGQQQANFGGTSDSTATEASIAEGSRVSTLSSSTDDLDDMLTELAAATGEVMLMELDPATVKKIAGDGAIWPELSRADVADQVYLEILAGSSGRPNRAQEIANWERAAPILTQTPGINPMWVARKVVGIIDESIDLEEALLEGMPSIVALNAAASKPPAPPPGAEGDEKGGGKGKQPGTGDAATDPAAQGAEGGQNAPRPAERPPGPQPAYPAPAA